MITEPPGRPQLTLAVAAAAANRRHRLLRTFPFNPPLCRLQLFVMFFAQGALVRWRKRHKRSYELATLVGLWLIPPIISLQLGGC